VHFTDRQWDAWNAVQSHRFVLYGGARGGGKSFFLRWGLLLFLLDLARHGVTGATVGLFCSTYPELRDRQVSKIAGEFPEGLGELRDSQTAGLGYYIRPEYGGGVIALRNLDDPEKYRSAEFAAIGIDELTLTDLETFNYLRGSLRWSGVDRTVFIAGTNPGGKGHGWVKNLWIDRSFPPEMRALSDEFYFVKSLPADNPHLTPQYWEDLNSLPPALSRAWVHGDWDVFEGQALAWVYDRHVVAPGHAIERLPDGWERWAHWRGVDWGFSAPFVCLWLTRDPDCGRVYAYREAYERGLTDRQQARLIMDMTPPDERVTMTYADPSMWASKSSGAIVTSTADEYLAAGVPLTRADNDRLSGKRKIDRLLQNLPDGKPGLVVLPACQNLIRTLPTLAYDRVHTEDIDTSQDDHCLIAGTLVTTNEGDKPIETVNVGDMVLTRQGYKRVIRSWLTQRQAQVYQVDFSDGRKLIGTAGHPVYVKTRGFVSIDALECYNEVITSLEANKWQRQSSSTTSSLGDIQRLKTGLREHITHHQAHIASAGLVSYIKRFGEVYMAKFQKDVIYITRMVMRSTIALKIWNVFQRTTIYQHMQNSIYRVLNTWHVSDHLQQNGINQPKDGLGIDYTHYNLNPKSACIVITAVKNTLGECIKYIISVLQPVAPLLEGVQGLMTLRRYAQFAEIPLQRTNTGILEPAHDCVVRVTGLCKVTDKQDVYNLEIEDAHEFFANGVLVHNCYDALRYGLTQAREYTPNKQRPRPPSPFEELIRNGK